MTASPATVPLVSVHNEWDPLEEVIVGSIDGARVPQHGPDMQAIEFANDPSNAPPAGPYPRQVIEETAADLETFCTTLAEAGITVRRPQGQSFSNVVRTPEWSSDGYYNYCPRDVLLAIGDVIIEAPMVLRSRQYEPWSYRSILLDYFDSGARWISAPRPRLRDSMYRAHAPNGSRLRNNEPAFDAANVLRFGTDILYQVSDSGNMSGAKWLQGVLGDTYHVHPCPDLYPDTHIDTTVVPLRPGLVLLNPARVKTENLPRFLQSWDHVWAPDMVETGFVGAAHGSPWIGMNLLVIRPGVAVVDDRQVELHRVLNSAGVEVIPMRLSHSRTLGGSFHCVSLDVRRAGTLETYR